jgi:hypothetical protein
MGHAYLPHDLNRAPLVGEFRSLLEAAVRSARDVAETAASAAISYLGVAEEESPPHLDEAQRALRRRLRAHGRVLGDLRQANGAQSVQHLVWEMAYEHWHRMLFARFLAERHLLMWESGVAVTLEECRYLAAESGSALGVRSGWELAGKLTAKMLPELLRLDSPVLEVTFAPEHQQALEHLLEGLPEDVFRAADSLGWAYQFWQGKRKEEVNASQVKVGADELAPVTQLFTEPYMVDYVLHNTVGKWWQLQHPHQAAQLPLHYLVLHRATEHEGATDSASSPATLSALKLLDPCCGSGHFLVAAFHLLVPMRILAEGLTAREAVLAVLRDNLHGVELDPRCVEIAAFALALAAWSYPDEAGAHLGFGSLPPMNLACSGRAPSGPRQNDSLGPAPLLGSLLPVGFDTAPIETVDMTRQTADEASAPEEEKEQTVAAQGLAQAMSLLNQRYDFVLTNPPFLGRGRMCDALRMFVEEHFYDGRHDLGAAFLEHCLNLAKPGGMVGCVIQQSWLFAGSYGPHRARVLQRDALRLVANLGEGAFRSVDAAGAFPSLLVFDRQAPSDAHQILVVDVAENRTADDKATALEGAEVGELAFAQVRESPDYLVALTQGGHLPLLSEFATPYVGLQTSDYPRYCRFFWELPVRTSDWEFMQEAPGETGKLTGFSSVFYWQQGNGDLVKSGLAYIRGQSAWDRPGVAVSRMRQLETSRYVGNFFNQTTAAIIPHDESLLPAILAFCSSNDYTTAVREVDRRICVANAALGRVRFDVARWQLEAARQFPQGLPELYSNDPTQWLFHGHPRASSDPLQVAVARLVGYTWPVEWDDGIDVSDAAEQWVARCSSLAAHKDDDGILCLPPVRGEKPAHERLLTLLIDAWESVEPDSWKTATLDRLLANADCAGKELEVWLRDKFFEQHTRCFNHSPFIWHVWDGLKDGFAALVNYHRLDDKNLERLIHTYLGDWIRTQEAGVRDGADGAPQRLAAAQNLKRRLELILSGEAPHDIFVRWKPLAEQPIGWHPDLNDGVRLNIRPFMTAEVLRHNKKPKLNITWDKDRGKEVESAPWFKAFKGDRFNDHHLALAEKRAERDRLSKA